MNQFYWKGNLSTGIEQFDQDHRFIINLSNKLYDALNNNGERAVILSCCFDLVNFTEGHFSREEQFMEDLDYPGREEHKMEHDRLKEEARKLLLRLELDTSASVTGLYHVLREIFISHIPEFDISLGKYYSLCQAQQ